jgi:hypothetical protein
MTLRCFLQVVSKLGLSAILLSTAGCTRHECDINQDLCNTHVDMSPLELVRSQDNTLQFNYDPRRFTAFSPASTADLSITVQQAAPIPVTWDHIVPPPANPFTATLIADDLYGLKTGIANIQLRLFDNPQVSFSVIVTNAFDAHNPVIYTDPSPDDSAPNPTWVGIDNGTIYVLQSGIKSNTLIAQIKQYTYDLDAANNKQKITLRDAGFGNQQLGVVTTALFDHQVLMFVGNDPKNPTSFMGRLCTSTCTTQYTSVINTSSMSAAAGKISSSDFVASDFLKGSAYTVTGYQVQNSAITPTMTRGGPTDTTMVRQVHISQLGPAKTDQVIAVRSASISVYDRQTDDTLIYNESASLSLQGSIAAGNLNALAFADVDNDGTTDVVAAVGEVISIYFGHPDGTYRKSIQTIAAPWPVSSMALGDVNLDGFADIVAVNTANKSIAVIPQKI